jgi:hypothetical protein
MGGNIHQTNGTLLAAYKYRRYRYIILNFHALSPEENKSLICYTYHEVSRGIRGLVDNENLTNQHKILVTGI